ncbi:MAG: hypothetical protein AAGF85_04100 [Bacteroidota bacterium]
MRKLVFVVILFPWVYLASSCEDVELETTGIDPFFRIKFINADSLSTLDNLIAAIEERIEIIDDSLVFYDTLDNGTDVSNIVERLNLERSAIDTERTEFNSTKAIIESGSVVVNSITSSTGVDAKLPGIDSTTLFSIPLNPAQDVSLFEISLDGTLYDLEANYTRNTVVELRTVIVQALDLDVTSSSFEVQSIEYEDSLSNNSLDAIVTVHF